MANTKISAFSAASALGGTEQLGGVQTAANAYITPAQIKTYCNTQGFIGGPSIQYPVINIGLNGSNSLTPSTVGTTLNAAALKIAFIGRLYMPGLATGATKTLSTGTISWNAGAVTFANGGTTLDVGIQGLSAAAGPVIRPDDTFTVKKTLTGGTDTINATTENTTTMATGSATLTNGAYTAVVFDMTGRGGADSVVLRHLGGAYTVLPCVQVFSAAAWAATVTASCPIARITTDDGTLCYFEGGISIVSSVAETWADATNPDERGLIMQVPQTCTANGMWFLGGVTDVNSTFTYNVFSDPTGTPTGLTGASGTFDPHLNVAASASDRIVYLPFSADVAISKNTNYALAIRATGSSNVRLSSWTVSASANRTWFGNGTAGKTTRDGGSGAFAAASTTVGYFMGLNITKVITG